MRQHALGWQGVRLVKFSVDLVRRNHHGNNKNQQTEAVTQRPEMHGPSFQLSTEQKQLESNNARLREGVQVRSLASWLPLCSRNLSGGVSRADEPHAENAMGGERVIHLAKETTDAETGKESSNFLKAGTGGYLISGRANSKSSFTLLESSFQTPPCEL